MEFAEASITLDFFRTFTPLICFLILGYCLQRISQLSKPTYLTLQDIPGPRSWVPILGNLLQLSSIYEAVNTVSRWNKKYNGFFKIQGMFQNIVIFHQPELIKQLLSSTDLDHCGKAAFVYDMLKPCISNSVLVSSGEFWQIQRRTVTNTQKLSVIRASMPLLNRRSYHLVLVLEKLFENGGQHPIGEFIYLTFLHIISEMVTGKEVKPNLEFQQYHHNIETWKSAMIKRLVQPYLLLPFFWFFHPARKVTLKAAHGITTYTKQLLNEHKNRKNNCDLDNSWNTDNHDYQVRSILQELLDAGMPDEQIIDEVNTMIAAGHETSATAIHFFCLKMAQHKDLQIKCQQEVDKFFETLGHVHPTYNDVNSGLKYVEQCLLETIRMYPPIVCYIRQLKAPLKVELDEKTYLIPEKTNVAVGPIVFQRDPTLWPEPEKFDPDRFFSEEMKKRHKFAFVPFSAGMRSCPGQKFAMLESKTVAAFLLRNFSFEVESGADSIKLIPATTITPERDYLFTLTKRVVK